MSDVKSASYTQVDNEQAEIVADEDVVILTSHQAYEKYPWSREYYDEEPKEGYFIWARRTTGKPISTCVLICSQYVTQDAQNVILIDEGVEAQMESACAAKMKSLFGKHIGRSKMILKDNAKLEYKHVHSWGEDDDVQSTTDLIMGKGSEVIYSQKCQRVPKSLRLINYNYIEESASLNYSATVIAKEGSVEMYDDTFLNGKKANGISRVRMIARDNAKFTGKSQIIANEAATGHMDCMGLILGDDSNIIAIPQLVNNCEDASITHEASVGKISEDVVNYLRSRGLSEDEAIDLVVNGFMGEEEDIVIDGVKLDSSLFM